MCAKQTNIQRERERERELTKSFIRLILSTKVLLKLLITVTN